MFETLLTVVGTLITNVSRRRLPDGSSVVRFRVARTERRYDRANECWGDGDTLFLSVTCWRQLAENVHQTFVVGDPIIVRGRVYTRSYEDKEGRRQSVLELEADAVGPDLARSVARVRRMRRDGTPVVAAGADQAGPVAAEQGDDRVGQPSGQADSSRGADDGGRTEVDPSAVEPPAGDVGEPTGLKAAVGA